jgi:tricorn protease
LSVEVAETLAVTVPSFRMYGPNDEWFAEGHGVEPDISVNENPAALAKGTDAQRDRAIAEAMDRVAKTPPAPAHLAYGEAHSAHGRGL